MNTGMPFLCTCHDRLDVMNQLSSPGLTLQKCDQGGERGKVFTDADQLSAGREEAALPAARE